MVSRFQRVTRAIAIGAGTCLVVGWLFTGCSDPDLQEVEVTAIHPAPGMESDATLPPTYEAPFNCFATKIGPNQSVMICEIPQSVRPGDPAPKNAGDPLR